MAIGGKNIRGIVQVLQCESTPAEGLLMEGVADGLLT